MCKNLPLLRKEGSHIQRKTCKTKLVFVTCKSQIIRHLSSSGCDIQCHWLTSTHVLKPCFHIKQICITVVFLQSGDSISLSWEKHYLKHRLARLHVRWTPCTPFRDRWRERGMYYLARGAHHDCCSFHNAWSNELQQITHKDLRCRAGYINARLRPTFCMPEQACECSHVWLEACQTCDMAAYVAPHVTQRQTVGCVKPFAHLSRHESAFTSDSGAVKHCVCGSTRYSSPRPL